METRLTSVEHHINGLIDERLPERVKILETGHKQLEESDRQLRILVETLSEQMKLYSEKQSETNYKVDSMTQSLQNLSGKVTETATIQQVYMNDIKGYFLFMQDFMKQNTESATAISKERETTKRERESTKRVWWTEFFKFAAVFLGGASGLALINYFLSQFVNQ